MIILSTSDGDAQPILDPKGLVPDATQKKKSQAILPRHIRLAIWHSTA
jgi:hypothetical protein